jgi:hypothetical protein
LGLFLLITWLEDVAALQLALSSVASFSDLLQHLCITDSLLPVHQQAQKLLAREAEVAPL